MSEAVQKNVKLAMVKSGIVFLLVCNGQLSLYLHILVRCWVVGRDRALWVCSYLDVDPNIKSHTIIFKQIVRTGTMTPYEFKFYDPAHIITGIACGPQDDKTSSPDAEVVHSGIGCHHVVIRL